MAILDTLIIQLTQGKFSLAKTAVQARNNVANKKQNSAELRSFRQDAMGAMALFTGGHSLNGLHNDDAHHMSTALDMLLQHLNAHQPQSLPTSNLGTIQTQNIAASSQRPIHEAIFVTPSPTHSLPSKTARQILPAQRDWKALLTKSNSTMQRALRAVEPNIHNIQHAFTVLTQARPYNAPSSPMPSIPALQCLSALTTARGIIAASSPPLSHGSIVSRRTATAEINHPNLHSTFPTPVGAPAEAHAIPSSSALPPTQHTIRHYVRQLEHIIYRATSPSADITPHAPPNLHTAPSLRTLTQHLETAAPSRQAATHHTTTHSPNVHITVNAAQGAPDDLAHIIEESAVKSLTRHTLFRTG